MDFIDALIKKLEEAKEELSKNMNCSYDSEQNVSKEELEKDAANPALAPKEVKVKKLQAQIDAGTYKPDPKKIAGAMLKEELYCSANGQWSLKKAKKIRNIEDIPAHDDLHRLMAEEADARTAGDTGVEWHDQEGLNDYGENSWFGVHGRHLENIANEWEQGKWNPPAQEAAPASVKPVAPAQPAPVAPAPVAQPTAAPAQQAKVIPFKPKA